MAISSTTVIKGVVWTVGFFVLSQSLRIVSSVVLTRLLTPEIYGILVIVFVIRNGIELLSDVGFVQSVVVNKNADEPAFYNTVWSLRLVRCLILFPVCVIAALPVAGLYQTPILGWILPVVGVYFVLGGLASLSPAFLQRRLQFARLNLFQFSVEAIATICQIIFAYLNPTVWAIIFGQFVTALSNAVGTYLLMPSLRHRFYVSKEYAWQVLRFGWWIFASSAIFFVSSNFDNVYLGTVVPLGVLGVYGLARQIAETLGGLAVKVNSTVIFPFIASHSHLPRAEFRKQLSSLRGRLLLLAALGFSILAATADLLIQTLYDHRYQSAGWMLSVMIIGKWFAMVCTIHEFNTHWFGQARLCCVFDGNKIRPAFDRPTSHVH